jgi:hypothetical protein
MLRVAEVAASGRRSAARAAPCWVLVDHAERLAGSELLTVLMKMREAAGANVGLLLISGVPWSSGRYLRDTANVGQPATMFVPGYTPQQLQKVRRAGLAARGRGGGGALCGFDSAGAGLVGWLGWCLSGPSPKMLGLWCLMLASDLLLSYMYVRQTSCIWCACGRYWSTGGSRSMVVNPRTLSATASFCSSWSLPCAAPPTTCWMYR